MTTADTYEVAKRVIQYKLPYGGRKEILEGYTIINTKTGVYSNRRFPDKDDAKTYAYKASKSGILKEKDQDELIVACMMSGNAFSEECNEIRERLDGK